MAAEKVFNEGDGVRLYLPEDKLVLVRKQSE